MLQLGAGKNRTLKIEGCGTQQHTKIPRASDAFFLIMALFAPGVERAGYKAPARLGDGDGDGADVYYGTAGLSLHGESSCDGVATAVVAIAA